MLGNGLSKRGRRLVRVLAVAAVAATLVSSAGCAATPTTSTTAVRSTTAALAVATPGPAAARAPRQATSTSSAPAASTQTPRARTVGSALVTTRVVRRTRFRGVGRVSAPPRVRARAWAVADLDTGRLLAVHRDRAHLPQASTIKLLTALTAADTVPAEPSHRVTRAEARPQWCTCAGLKVGRRYSRTALLAGMLLPSGNDAALALAGAAGHGQDWFVDAMNAKAVELGARDTHVVTPNGLTAAGAYSSARDLLIFLRAAQANRVVEPVLELSTYPLGPRGGHTHLVFRANDYVNRYARVDSGTQGKSGYTTPAKNTLVVATPLRGHRIGVAELGAPSGWTTSEARALTLWAAANLGRLQPVGQLPATPGPPLGQATGARPGTD
jgi:D-alanyl-D-alanine carboxypeptidase (penicillin-binding protein 5/6)